MGSLNLSELGSLGRIPRRDAPWGIRPEHNPVADWGLSGNDIHVPPGSLGSLGDERDEATTAYWALKDRGLETASKIMDLADQYAQVQAIKKAAKEEMARTIAKGVPPPVAGGMFGISGAVAWAVQIAGLFGKYLKPAVDKIDAVFSEQEEKMKDGAALLAWLEGKFRANVDPAMRDIRKVIGAGQYSRDQWVVEIAQKAGVAPPDLNLYAEEWAGRGLGIALAYVKRVAPDLATASVQSPRQAKMAALLQRSIDRQEIAQKYGIPTSNVETALRSVGLGIEPITVTIIILAVLLAATATAAGYYYIKAKAVADVGKSEIDKLISFTNDEVIANLKEQARQSVEAVAKNPALKDSEQAKIERVANEERFKLEAKAAQAKAAIDDAKGADLGDVLKYAGIGLAALAAIFILK